MEIFLIDAIGPFFKGYSKRRINWSKIPFSNLKLEPTSRRKQFDRIAVDLNTFCKAVSEIGYNSVSLDDVAHLAPHQLLEQDINNSISILQEEYRTLFAICKSYDLKIFLTMDVLSFTPKLIREISGSKTKAIKYLKEQVETILSGFPEVNGIIFRIGESDGKDVKGQFKSKLILRSSADVNKMLREVLPIFEKHDKLLILRTWTVGAYQIGDLIWHRKTTSRALRNINSPNFILSMKYGESDFFRYLPLNKHFYRVPCKKIIELQARREYEGCGEYPSFIGWDYEQYALALQNVKNMVGMSVWCQTGGWVPFRRLTYLEPEGIWNELNSHISIKIFKDKLSVEQAVEDFCNKINCKNVEKFLEFLRLNDEVIKELLYIEEVATQKLFFRRVRIPPLLSVFWNTIFINHSVRKILRSLVSCPKESVDTGYNALIKIDSMIELSIDLDLPPEDIIFMKDTFSLLALAREYYFLPYNAKLKRQIKSAKKEYKIKYPKSIRPRYRVKTSFAEFKISRKYVQWFLQISLRQKRGYRVVDYLLTLHLLGMCYRLLVRFKPTIVPKFAKKQAMGIETIFK